MKLFFKTSAKLKIEDIDWEAGRRAGLSEEEQFILRYFSDIESQTIVYLRDLLQTQAALNPDVISFLSIWNYEEHFHGHALAKLMEECGYKMESDSVKQVRAKSRLSEKLESMGSSLISSLFPQEFPAIYMTWGAIQEFTTLNGYQQLAKRTRNPVLKILCQRIIEQEWRHFAWYYFGAKKKLEQYPRARKLTRWALKHLWSPVGAGVKSDAEVSRLLLTLFPEGECMKMAQVVDQKISTLPGLGGLQLMGAYTSALKSA